MRLPTLLLAALLLTACGHKPKEGESIGEVCKAANDRKEVTVSGYLRGPKMFTFCGKSCGMRVVERMSQKDDAKGITVSIDVGDGKNQLEALPKKFTESDIHVTDKGGAKAGVGSVVRLTGKALVSDDSCQIVDVTRIEKL